VYCTRDNARELVMIHDELLMVKGFTVDSIDILRYMNH